MCTMKKLSDNIKFPEGFVELTEQEMIDSFNQDVGHLNDEDGVDCPTCRNKGYVYFLNENGDRSVKDCTCMKQRKTIKRIKECGITKTMLDHYKFKNFIIKDDWQKTLKNKVLDYTKNIVDGKRDWLVISGVSGCG